MVNYSHIVNIEFISRGRKQVFAESFKSLMSLVFLSCVDLGACNFVGTIFTVILPKCSTNGIRTMVGDPNK